MDSQSLMIFVAIFFVVMVLVGTHDAMNKRLPKPKVTSPSEQEAKKQIAWTLYHAGYDLTDEQRALLRLPEDDDKKGA